MAQLQDTEIYRDKVATIDDSGKRTWLYPKKPKGKFYTARNYVSWVLLAFLFGMPFIKVNGDPLLLFNIIERRFIIFGIQFAPQDFHLFVLAMLIGIIIVALFTVVFGRLFCGWVCPQTIFMEMVFRKIEYWIEGDANAQKRLNKAPWTADKIFKKAAKQAIFFAIAVLVANTFLSYIIGIENVKQIASEPVQQNMVGFIAMIAFSGAFYFVFSYMREQVCVAICPYGRMQSVLIDEDSVVVHYDHVRGEPRGRMKKNRKSRKKPKPAPVPASVADDNCTCADCKNDGCKATNALAQMQAAITQIEEPKIGDCIDCNLCVKVCPTGIDIRNGTQLECINCTACMDECDTVMEKIGREKGLIRYDSYNGIVEGKKTIFTNRVKAYTAVLVALMILEGILLTSRTDVEGLLLRTPGMLYQEVDETTISNLYNYQIINKTSDDLPIEFVLPTEYGSIKLVGDAPTATHNEVTEGALFIMMPRTELESRKNKIMVEIRSGDKVLDKVKTTFFAPVK